MEADLGGLLFDEGFEDGGNPGDRRLRFSIDSGKVSIFLLNPIFRYDKLQYKASVRQYSLYCPLNVLNAYFRCKR